MPSRSRGSSRGLLRTLVAPVATFRGARRPATFDRVFLAPRPTGRLLVDIVRRRCLSRRVRILSNFIGFRTPTMLRHVNRTIRSSVPVASEKIRRSYVEVFDGEEKNKMKLIFESVLTSPKRRTPPGRHEQLTRSLDCSWSLSLPPVVCISQRQALISLKKILGLSATDTLSR